MQKVVNLTLPSDSVSGDRFLRLPRVIERVGLSRTSIYLGVKNNTFPAPIKLSDDGRAVAWTASSIDAWIKARIDSTFQQEAA